MDRIKNEYIKEIMEVKVTPETIDIIGKERLQWYGQVESMPEERTQKLIIKWIPQERRNRGCPRKKLDGRITSSHYSKKFRTR
jgi:hypothetical protein